jgi:maleylpyruvate isomerase
VRIALNLKGLAYEYVPAGSLPPGEYRRINPQGLLPALETNGGIIAQSSAILDYLEETFPSPPILPADPILRAQSRAFGADRGGDARDHGQPCAHIRRRGARHRR